MTEGIVNPERSGSSDKVEMNPYETEREMTKWLVAPPITEFQRFAKEDETSPIDGVLRHEAMNRLLDLEQQKAKRSKHVKNPMNSQYFTTTRIT